MSAVFVDNLQTRSTTRDPRSPAPRQAGYPQGMCSDACACAPSTLTIRTTPEKAATSLQGLTDTTPEPAKTRGVRMADAKDRCAG